MYRKLLAIAIAIATMLVGMASHASADTGPEWRWEERRTVCVEDRMPSNWTSPEGATAELNKLWFWDMRHRNGAGSCDAFDQVIVLDDVNMPGRARAWTSKTCVYKEDQWGKTYCAITGANIFMNLYHGIGGYTHNKETLIHEQLHAMMRPRGKTWANGQTSRCDSMLADRHWCLHSQDHLTAFDIETAERAYRAWRTFQAS